jgi:16S rRNA G966 N2-methylase RsmD
MDIGHLKCLLREVLHGEDPSVIAQAAANIDALAESWQPKLAHGPVHVTVEGWPDWMNIKSRNDIAGFDVSGTQMDVRRAAAIRHHLHGHLLGGSQLQVNIALNAGEILPTVHREDRSRHRHHGTQPWLPHLDEVGRISATPRAIAAFQATLLKHTRVVIDPFCGLGANAIACALGGTQVWASDISPERLHLANKNAQHFGVDDQIRFRQQNAQETLNGTKPDGFGLFLDPPWGGADWDRSQMNLGVWMRQWPFLGGVIQAADAVVLKLPRSFDVSSLKTLGLSWKLEVGLGPPLDSPADRVRLITAYSSKTKH